MTDELKPCPFCGSDDLCPDYEDRGSSHEYAAWINCGGCGVDGPVTAWKFSYKEAADSAWELWNKREG
ncbi:Lar family restriction alleviation protein [Xenorhabdus nematophila]|uniref:Lar family restriction alleviation protein n=1 Tax=Xenorhabdus nematophila TaxID=628 RepID=UPI0032B7EB01